ncbi:MAG: Smr/MutS family protein [Thermoanaerobaculia bacterium]
MRAPRAESEGDDAAESADAAETPEEAAELCAEAVVELPFEDVLDLHGFPPRDVREIVLGYLEDADAAGFAAVRIVHGRGMGVQREAVRALLARDERVIEFSDAPESQGGRGATLVRLRRGGDAP